MNGIRTPHCLAEQGGVLALKKDEVAKYYKSAGADPNLYSEV